jgi:N-acetylmuramoyl-L-alanine amidase
LKEIDMTTTLDTQRRLIALGYNPGLPDGIPGPKTTDEIKRFQKDYGLVVDGIAGKQTIAAMKQAQASPKPAKPEPDKEAMQFPASVGTPQASGAKPPPNVSSLKLLDTARAIKELIWHCAATPEGKDFTVEDIRSWHKQRGWSDIGYHFVVYRDGRIMVGRPVGQIGAHCEGHNTGAVGCCYIGGVSADGKKPKDTRTPEQRASMLWLTEQLVKKFPITQVTGHNQYAAKACPSFYVHNDPLSKLAR